MIVTSAIDALRRADNTSVVPLHSLRAVSK